MVKGERLTSVFSGLTVLLVAAIGIGAILVLLLTREPAAHEIRYEVGQPQASTCPVGSGAPACYRFEVRNMGGGDGVARCLATAAPNTEVTLEGGAPAANVALGSGESRSVFVGVIPSPGGTATAPALTCT